MTSQLHSITEYAKLCGVRPATIYLRIKNKQLIAFKHTVNGSTCYVVDSIKFPPLQAQKSGRKPFKVS